MDNDDDFTFCKVDQDGPETKKLAVEMDGIRINGEVGPTSSDQIGFLSKDNNSPNTTVSWRQDTVGSLSFSITDTSKNPKQQSSQKSTKQPISGDVGQIKKPTVRAKVPFEKGYRQSNGLDQIYKNTS